MFNRLVAENTIKAALRGNTGFSISNKFLAYEVETAIRVICICRECKEIQIPYEGKLIAFGVSSSQSWLYLLTDLHILAFFSIELVQQGLIMKRICQISQVNAYKEVRQGVLLEHIDGTIKHISERDLTNCGVITADSINSIADGMHKSKMISSAESSSFLLRKQTSTMQLYEKRKVYEKTLTLDYALNVFTIYRDRYLFQQGSKQLQIYDIEQGKQVGRLPFYGEFKHFELKGNLLLLITNNGVNDYYTFLVLDSNPVTNRPLVLNKAVYEKGKTDCYAMINMSTTDTNYIVERKKSIEVNFLPVTQISIDTSSVIFTLSKAKEKIEIIRLDHSKLLKSPFVDEKIDFVVFPTATTVANENAVISQQEKVTIEKAQVQSGMDVAREQMTVAQAQRKFVQHMIDTKLRSVMRKFLQLEKRVQSLEKSIKGVYEKIEGSLEKINRQEIRANVELLFQDLTPQFERYFAEIFKQVSSVLEQGANYYNLKLAKQAQIHKEALSQIVMETFKASEEICQIGRKEMQVSSRTQESLRKVLQAKKKWTKTTEQFEARTKDEKMQRPPGKQFVKADLNYNNPKRET